VGEANLDDSVACAYQFLCTFLLCYVKDWLENVIETVRIMAGEWIRWVVRLGRVHKNEERKKQRLHQDLGTNKMGRPTKKVCELIVLTY